MTTKKSGSRARRVADTTAEAEAEFAILFPFESVELTTGEKIDVPQWNIDTGARLTSRVVALMERLRESQVSGTVDPETLVQVAKEECLDIVCGTIGWTRAKLNARVPFEDFLTLLDVVANQNLVRPDGGGVLPKIVGLAGVLGGLSAAGSASPPQSISSSEPDTPSPTSDA